LTRLIYEGDAMTPELSAALVTLIDYLLWTVVIFNIWMIAKAIREWVTE